MRDLDVIDSELRLLTAVRRTTQAIYGRASAMIQIDRLAMNARWADRSGNNGASELLSTTIQGAFLSAVAVRLHRRHG
jgi:hypothetical protein